MCVCPGGGGSVFLKGHVLPGFNIETLDMWTEALCMHVLQRNVSEVVPTDRWLLQHRSQNQQP